MPAPMAAEITHNASTKPSRMVPSRKPDAESSSQSAQLKSAAENHNSPRAPVNNLISGILYALGHVPIAASERCFTGMRGSAHAQRRRRAVISSGSEPQPQPPQGRAKRRSG